MNQIAQCSPFPVMGMTKERAERSARSLKASGATMLYLQGAWIGRRFCVIGFAPSWHTPAPPKPTIDHDDLTLTIPTGHDIKNACIAFGASITRRTRDRQDFFEYVQAAAGAVHIAHAWDHRAVCGHVEAWAEGCVTEEDVSCAECLSKTKTSAAKLYRARHSIA